MYLKFQQRTIDYLRNNKFNVDVFVIYYKIFNQIYCDVKSIMYPIIIFIVQLLVKWKFKSVLKFKCMSS